MATTRLVGRYCIAGGLALGLAFGAGFGCSDDEEPGGNEVGGPGVSSAGGAAGNSGVFIDAGDEGGTIIPVEGGGGADNCGTEAVEADIRQVNVLVVIDKSGSMSDTPTGFDTDKWAAIQSALDQALTATAEQLWYGLMVFPDPGGVDGCEMVTDASAVRVNVAQGTSSVSDILTELGGITPSGGTPTSTALLGALEYFTNGEGATLEGDNVVLLATDGGPNCNDQLTCDATTCTPNLDGLCPGGVANCCENVPDQCLDDLSTVAEIARLQTAGISTFVVGIPGSEAYGASLDAMAQAGGHPNPATTSDYFAVSADGGAQGLADVLISITEDLITSCELQIQELPAEWDPAKVNVEIDGEPIPQEDQNGWYLDMDTDPPTVILVGDTCTQVETEGAGSVNITFGCPTVLPG